DIIKARNQTSGGGTRAAISYGPVTVSVNGQANLAAWKATNASTTAFLRIPGTNINYPVMHGTSYEYKQQSGASGKRPGSIWVHTGSLASKAGMQGNTVITGHNWGNCTGAYPYIGNVTSAGRMDQLLSYTSPAFASANPYITLSIPGQDLTLAVIAAFYVPNIYIDNACIYNGNAESLAASAKARSLFSSGVGVSSGDKLVTFFTCSRYLNTGANQRFVVVTKVL
ncbi:MAG: class B sortase, partial [Acetanaerobacterium sp.]